MSEQMDRAVLTMPYELAMGDELSRMQFWSRVQLVYKEQCARIEADEALMRTNLEVLETALDTANEVATSIRITYAGYMNHRQKAADAEVEKIDAAITALRTRLDAPVQGGEG